MKKQFNTPFGTFVLDSERDNKMVSYFERGIHHQEEDVTILQKYITKDSIVLDIGAHVGTMTIPLAKVAKQVFAFEPVSKTRGYLEENLNLNNVTNVTIYPYALGNKEGRVGMIERSASNAGAYTVGEGNDIEIKTLDSLIQKADVIKIDIEGSEPDALEGAQNLIKTNRPIIFFEVNLPELRKHGKQPLRRMTQALKNYSFYVSGRRVPYLWMAALILEPKFFLINKGGIVFNVLAMPKSKKS